MLVTVLILSSEMASAISMCLYVYVYIFFYPGQLCYFLKLGSCNHYVRVASEVDAGVAGALVEFAAELSRSSIKENRSSPTTSLTNLPED